MDGIDLMNVSHVYQNQPMVTDMTLHIQKHKITCLIGPNGAGKSTLLKLLAGLLSPQQGVILLDQRNIRDYPRRALAKKLSYLPQQCRLPPALTVKEYVALGRFSHQTWFANLQPQDHLAIEQAMEMTDIVPLANQLVTTLSGGEQQRARIALMLAQQADYLLLDEPMTGLDIKQQCNLISLFSRLQKQHGKTIIIILHDLQQAISIADNVILLKQGHVLGMGTPQAMIHPDNLLKIYDYPFDLIPVSGNQAFYILPKRHPCS